jgi:hypothetical protein
MPLNGFYGIDKVNFIDAEVIAVFLLLNPNARQKVNPAAVQITKHVRISSNGANSLV